jgi:hypothetical protein
LRIDNLSGDFAFNVEVRPVSLLPRLDSLFLEKNSLIRVWKFPVPLRREFGWKPKFPVNSGEFGAETGSQLTASSASQSRLYGICPGRKNLCVIPASYADDGESLSRFFLCFPEFCALVSGR